MNKKFFHRMLNVTIQHPYIIFAAVVVITVIMGYFMVKVKIDPDAANLLPANKEALELAKQYGTGEEQAEYMMIAFESSNPLTLESLAALQDAVTRIEVLQEVKSVISPFNLITFQKDGKRLQIMPMSPGNRAPKNDEELEKFKDRLFKDPFAKKMVISEDGTVLNVVMS
ncbi:MAG: hypothetical protein E4H36_03150, partial [Spirochaetales bacterium]